MEALAGHRRNRTAIMAEGGALALVGESSLLLFLSRNRCLSPLSQVRNLLSPASLSGS